MKNNTKYIASLSLLMASLMLASSTMAQSIEGRQTETEKKTHSIHSVAAARSKYTQTTTSSPGAEDTTLAQLRGGPGRPFPSQRPYPRGTYQTPWTDHGNAGHILVGAAIGFGIGAAIGAHNGTRDGTPVAGGIIIGGGLFALLGGCVGKAVGDLQGLHFASAHHRGTFRPSGNEDDQESHVGLHSNAKKNPTEASATSASPVPAIVLRRVEP
jgi:hypothetical protein